MAEIFGAVSGGAGLLSLAVQLGENGLKLKSFYSKVKHAPKTLETLSYDIQTLSLTLQELERHRQRDDPDVLLLDRCISRCQEIADTITQLVHKLESRIDRFRIAGKTYAALKGSEITELLDGLEEAKSSMMLALQMFSVSRQDRQDRKFNLQLQQSVCC